MPWWGYGPWCSRGLEPGNARAASPAPTSWLSCRLCLGAGAVGAGAKQPWAASPRNRPGPSTSCFKVGGAKQPQIPLQMSSCTGSSTSQLWWTLHREGQCGSIHSHLSAPTYQSAPWRAVQRWHTPWGHGSSGPLQTRSPWLYQPSHSPRPAVGRAGGCPLPHQQASTPASLGTLSGHQKIQRHKGAAVLVSLSMVTALSPGTAVPAARRTAVGSGH